MGVEMTVAIPTAIYVVSLWVLQEHPLAKNKIDALVHPLTAVLVLLTGFWWWCVWYDIWSKRTKWGGMCV